MSAQSLGQGSLELSLSLSGGTARLLADRELSQSAHTWGQGIDSFGLKQGGFLKHLHKPASHIQLVSQLGIKYLDSKPSLSPVLTCALTDPQASISPTTPRDRWRKTMFVFPCPSASKQREHSLSQLSSPHPGARNIKEIPENLPSAICCSFHSQ